MQRSLTTQAPSSTVIIEGKLYLGNLASSLDLEYRTRLGITHVVCVCPEGWEALASLADPHHDDDNIREPPSSGKHYETEHYLYIPIKDDEYEDILVHLPRACAFIEKVVGSSDGGAGGKPESRVLVHCQMGVSRSAAVVAAYLMKSRQLTAAAAVDYIQTRRPAVHPNYGFQKQLELFERCNCTCPQPRDSVYRTWKRKYVHDVQSYLGYLGDVVSIGTSGCSGEGARLYLMTSDFPEDLQKSRHLLREFELTHVVVMGGDSGACQLREAAKELALQIHEVSDPRCARDDWGELEGELNTTWLKKSALVASRWVSQALGELDSNDAKGSVLIYSPNHEGRACVVICAYFMASRRLTSKEALSVLRKYLPLFMPSQKFLRQLEALDGLSVDSPNTTMASTGIRAPTVPPLEQVATAATELVQIIEKTCSLIQSESAHSTAESANLVLQSATIQSPPLVSF